jgi:hypothetical protein
MATLDSLKNVRFVMDASGKQAAVQVSMEDWQNILEYFEEVEDREAVKKILHSLKSGPEGSNALDWKEAREQW